MQTSNRNTAKRVLISLSPVLLTAVDRQAKADYTTRSDLVRHALLEYLRPPGDQADEQDLFTDPNEVLGILQRRKLRIYLQTVHKDRVQGYSSKSTKPTLK